MDKKIKKEKNIKKPIIIEDTITQIFNSMFANVSPWPGVSQASQKSKKEQNVNLNELNGNELNGNELNGDKLINGNKLNSNDSASIFASNAISELREDVNGVNSKYTMW